MPKKKSSEGKFTHMKLICHLNLIKHLLNTNQAEYPDSELTNVAIPQPHSHSQVRSKYLAAMEVSIRTLTLDYPPGFDHTLEREM